MSSSVLEFIPAQSVLSFTENRGGSVVERSSLVRGLSGSILARVGLGVDKLHVRKFSLSSPFSCYLLHSSNSPIIIHSPQLKDRTFLKTLNKSQLNFSYICLVHCE